MTFPETFPYIAQLRQIAGRKKVAVYLIGGFIRNFLLKIPCTDLDFAVERDAIPLAKAFAKTIKGVFILLDEEHGCARVAKKSKGTLWTFDFADFRAKDLKGDLGHRDFTVNTLCVDIAHLKEDTNISSEIIDVCAGQKDLKAGRIKMTSTDVFKEDPLRLMRAFSLQAVLDFTIEAKTRAQIKKDCALLRDVSRERVREELFKVLESSRASEVLVSMDAIGLLREVIPQIAVMYGVQQGGYHHLDVWQHTLEAVRQFDGVLEEFQNHSQVQAYLDERVGGGHSRRALIRLALLLHDIGKPDTRKDEGERFSFHGHEAVGKQITRDTALLLKLSVKERHALEDMVYYHLRPGYLSNFKLPSKRAVFRFFRDAKDEAIAILLLSMADQRATRGPMTTEADQEHHRTIAHRLIAEHFQSPQRQSPTPLINGWDLIRTLKLKPSPLFATILTTIQEEQATGKVSTKADALALARKIAETKNRRKPSSTSQVE